MIAKVYVAVLMCVDSEKTACSWLAHRFELCYEGSIQLLSSDPRVIVVHSPWMSIVSEPQLAGGLTSIAPLNTLLVLILSRLIIPELNVTVYVCNYLKRAHTS